MTPKEKAKELVDKISECGEDNEMYIVTAKNCALVTVEEVINILFQHHEIDYWKEVKQEIEKL